jgi:hypothetical protein
MSNVPNPSVADRSDSKWWAAPIGVGTVNSTPVFLADLPIGDPHVVGQLYNASGVVTVSNG